ncbi:Superoxide dismutase [Cu-Zn], partial [Armadillidium vulgare]
EGTGYVHGFHIHENPIQEQKHVGDLGNIRVDDKGRFENQVISDDQVAFFGDGSIIGRSIVVHLKADDLGLGGDEESLKTGNAGARLACCTIESINVPKPAKPVIRFNG